MELFRHPLKYQDFSKIGLNIMIWFNYDAILENVEILFFWIKKEMLKYSKVLFVQDSSGLQYSLIIFYYDHNYNNMVETILL